MERSIQEDLNLATQIVQSCATYLWANRNRLKEFKKIGENALPEVVTNLDIEINELAVAKIRDCRPQDVIVGEEVTVGTPLDHYWVIDPIDGTRSFLDGRAGSAIVLSIVSYNLPIVSVVYDITAKRTVQIYRGSIIECDHAIKIPETTARVALWNPYLRESTLLDRIVETMELDGVIECESTALRALALAEGRGCVLISLPGNSKLWDSASAIQIISAVGGRYTDFLGNPIQLHPDAPLNTRGAIGSVGIPHAQLLHLLKPWSS